MLQPVSAKLRVHRVISEQSGEMRAYTLTFVNVRWYILGGFALLLGSGVFMMTRAPGAGANHASPIVADRGALLLDVLKEEMFQLESDRINAKITLSEYEQAKAALDVALRRAMSRKP